MRNRSLRCTQLQKIVLTRLFLPYSRHLRDQSPGISWRLYGSLDRRLDPFEEQCEVEQRARMSDRVSKQESLDLLCRGLAYPGG